MTGLPKAARTQYWLLKRLTTAFVIRIPDSWPQFAEEYVRNEIIAYVFDDILKELSRQKVDE